MKSSDIYAPGGECRISDMHRETEIFRTAPAELCRRSSEFYDSEKPDGSEKRSGGT